MAGLLPPVIATLIADTKEYMAKMDAAQAKMAEFGVESDASASIFSGATASIAFGAAGVATAIGAYAVDAALKFNETMDKVRLQAGLTEEQTKQLGNSILNISSTLGVANTDLASGALTIEQAGIKGAAATKLLDDAAKASVITNASVADSVQAVVAAQSLQIAKGMDVTKLTGILVKGSQDFIGGLSQEEQMLSGRVGVALSGYGLSLKTIIALGSQFAKINLPTRSISTFASTLGKLTGYMKPKDLATYKQELDAVGLSYSQLASYARTGNVVGILQEVNKAAKDGTASIPQLVSAITGSATSASNATWEALLKNVTGVGTALKNVQGAGTASLAKQTQEALNTPAQQIKIFEQSLNKAFINLGTVALPWVITGVKFATGVLKDIEDLINPKTRPKTEKNLAESFWNANVAVISSVIKTFATGNPMNLFQSQSLPSWLTFNGGSSSSSSSKPKVNINANVYTSTRYAGRK